MPVKNDVDTATTLATFGLKPDIEPPEELTITSDAESEELEEVDASDTDTEEEAFDEEEEELEEEEDEDDDNPGLKDEIQKREAAEKQMREWQSRHDSLQAQVSQMITDFNQLKASKGESEDDDESIDLDDDELIDGRTLKKLVAQQTKKASKGKEGQYERYYQSQQLAQNQYITQLSDVDEIKSYVDDKNLANDPKFTKIPTDTIGLYYAVKARKLEEENESLKKEKSKMIKRKGRNSLPPTGGGNRASKGTSSQGSISDFEKKYLGFFEKRGFDSTNHRKSS